MANDAAFIGSIPQHYDQGLGPMIFVGYPADISRRTATVSPARAASSMAIR